MYKRKNKTCKKNKQNENNAKINLYLVVYNINNKNIYTLGQIV